MMIGVDILIRLKLRSRSWHRLLFVLLVAFLLTSPGVAASSKPQMAQKTGELVGDNLFESLPIANQPLAMKRYRMLKKIERQIGFFPLEGRSLESYHNVIFPLGRGDKVYLFFLGMYFKVNGYAGDQVLCYEAKGNSVKLVYSLKLKMVNKPPKDRIPIGSILGYLSWIGGNDYIRMVAFHDAPEVFSWTLPGNTSKFARRDLSLKQDFVEYTYNPMNDGLFVQPFSSKHVEVHGESSPQQVFWGVDDYAKWYKTYGLPVADCELVPESKQK